MIGNYYKEYNLREEQEISKSKRESGTERSGVSILRLASGNRSAAEVCAVLKFQIQI